MQALLDESLANRALSYNQQFDRRCPTLGRAHYQLILNIRHSAKRAR